MAATCGRGRRARPDYAVIPRMAGAIRANLALAQALFGLLLVLVAALPARAADGGAFAEGLLWRIEKNGLPASHVFGTIHLADPRVTALPAPVRERFNEARAFGMEVPLEATDLATLATRMIYADGRDLPSTLGAALYGRLLPELAKAGVTPDLARLFKPWAAMMLLEMPRQESAEVLDLYLQRTAVAQGKTLFYLESVDEQIDALDGMGEGEQVALLRHTLESQPERARSIDRMREAYLRRDLAAMWRLGEEDIAGRPDLKPLQAVFVQRLLLDRNRRMAERLQARLGGGASFVAVGALHLYGAQGVLALLQAAGYRVTRVY